MNDLLANDPAAAVVAGMGQDATQQQTALDWPERFERRFGRKPRVLHICNIANYAYVNAKLMRRYGVEADVLCPDMYHIMATPEWHETEVIGTIANEFYPEWRKLRFGSFQRPDWFIQGPRNLAFAYLGSRAAGRQRAAAWLRHRVKFTSALRAHVENHDDLIARFTRSEDRRIMLLKRALRKLLTGARLRAAAKQGGGAKAVDVAGPALPEALLPLQYAPPSLRSTLMAYDVVQGYTVAAMYPAAFGLRNFTAYELGTLRGLPFEDSPMGRLCAWVYRAAPVSFVTNVDCIEAAERLGIPHDRIRPVLHAFDCDQALSYHAEPDPAIPTARPFFFAPARHHWKNGNASWLKGNDVIIRAAEQLKRCGYDFRIIFVHWGQEIDESKRLIEELDLADRVEWVMPMSRPRVWRYYATAAAVIDQFNAAAFGGVALETLALGRRLITRFDNEAGSTFFSRPPPILNCATVEEVCAAMRQVLDDPGDNAGLGAQGRHWMATEHSVPRQMEAQFAVYASMTGC